MKCVLINCDIDLLESAKTLCAAGIRSVAAIPLEICERGGCGGVTGGGEVEGGGAGEGSDLVEPNAAEAQDCVARGVGLRKVNVAALQRVLERVDALLIVVRDHREVRARRRSRGGDLQRRSRVGRKKPRCQHRTTPAPVKVSPAGGADAAKKLVRQVQPTRLRFRLNRKRRNSVRIGITIGVQRLGPLGKQTSKRATTKAEHDSHKRQEINLHLH